MSNRGGVNPFYWALVVVGTIFAVTACAYAVMAVRRLDPLTPEEGGLIGFLADYGVTVVLVLLALLTVLTFAAIGADDFFTGRQDLQAAGPGAQPPAKETPPDAASAPHPAPSPREPSP